MNKDLSIYKPLLLLTLVLCHTFSINATEYKVNNITSFNSAQVLAMQGDIITWINGTYTDIDIVIGKSGLTVRAETPGRVIFNGKSKCQINGSSNIFAGFQFLQGDIGNNLLLVVNGSRNKITQINFFKVSAHKYVVFSGGSQYNELSFCNIEGKPMTEINSAVQITTSPTIIGYHVIKYCSFKNFPGPGGDAGNEPIRIGLSTEKYNVSRTIVEYCYFENVGLGDSESISIKSCENVCRYNTFNNNPGGMLVFRQGYRNAAYGNFFINGSGGIRLKAGGNDYVYNNYFNTGSAVPITLNFEEEFPLDKVSILHNTFVECAALELTDLGPKNVVFANNIFQKKSGQILNGTTNSISFVGNIINGAFGIPVPIGNTVADAKLELNSDGYYGLSSLSRCIDASDINYEQVYDIPEIDDDPFLMLDIGGQTRPNQKLLKDLGCDEYTIGEIKNRPLKLKDVGPTYLISTIVEQEK